MRSVMLKQAGTLVTPRTAVTGCSRGLMAAASLKQSQPMEGQPRPPVYELRTYTIYPEKIREYLSIVAKDFHLRTNHSKLIGFWTAEIGGLNQVVHIWEYSNLAERAGVRARLAADPEWMGSFVSRTAPMMQSQDNAMLIDLPGTHLNPPKSKGVYELQTLEMQGSPSVWSGALVQYVQASEKACQGQGSAVVGMWRYFLGSRQAAAVLWQHQGPDGCMALADAAAGLPEAQALDSLVTKGHNKLLLPHTVSPLQ